MTALPARVVFLDVDGPMIPSTCVLADRAAGLMRRFPPTTIAVVNELCSRSGARIVTNTHQNLPRPGVPDLHDALVAHGLDPVHLHPTHPATAHPDGDRGEAVSEWLAAHPEVVDWVAFDDTVFTRADELIWVDPDSGLTLCHLNQALDRFGCATVDIFV